MVREHRRDAPGTRAKSSERTKLLETIRWIDLIGRVHLRDAPGTGPRPSERAKEAELAS
jgi:hypothetical protein